MINDKSLLSNPDSLWNQDILECNLPRTKDNPDDLWHQELFESNTPSVKGEADMLKRTGKDPNDIGARCSVIVTGGCNEAIGNSNESSDEHIPESPTRNDMTSHSYSTEILHNSLASPVRDREIYTRNGYLETKIIDLEENESDEEMERNVHDSRHVNAKDKDLSYEDVNDTVVPRKEIWRKKLLV